MENSTNFVKFKEMEFEKDTTTVVLICSIEQKETKNRGAYCHLLISDGDEKVECNYWNSSKEEFEKFAKAGDLITAKLYTKLYQGMKSFELKRISKAPEGVSPLDFIIKAPMESQAMFDGIIDGIKKLGSGSGNLSTMVENIYHKYQDKLLVSSAAKSIHHNFYGGLLYHTTRMLRAGMMLSKVYPEILDTELLFAGIALHDIGKLIEIETSVLGDAEYTSDGMMFGHAMMGIEIINDEFNMNHLLYDEEKVKMLKHMLASHHGKLEWGAISLPAIPEASILHEIDMIDSRIMQFEDIYKNLEPGKTSEKSFGLGCSVYKPKYK